MQKTGILVQNGKKQTLLRQSTAPKTLERVLKDHAKSYLGYRSVPHVMFQLYGEIISAFFLLPESLLLIEFCTCISCPIQEIIQCRTLLYCTLPVSHKFFLYIITQHILYWYTYYSCIRIQSDSTKSNELTLHTTIAQSDFLLLVLGFCKETLYQTQYITHTITQSGTHEYYCIRTSLNTKGFLDSAVTYTRSVRLCYLQALEHHLHCWFSFLILRSTAK